MTGPDPRRLKDAPFETQRAFLIKAVTADPAVEAIFERAPYLPLPGWRLVSGAIYQNVWNALTGRAPGYGIKDYDLAYYDPDLSWEAEDRVISACAAAFADLGAEIEVRNQARVHLWFGPKFGIDYPPLASVEDGIDRYAADLHKAGLRRDAGGFDLYAPAGLEAMFDLRAEPCVRLADPEGFIAKIERQKALWPQMKACGPGAV